MSYNEVSYNECSLFLFYIHEKIIIYIAFKSFSTSIVVIHPFEVGIYTIK